MKTSALLLPFGTGMALFIMAGSASAWPSYEDQVPNGNVTGCSTCHTIAPLLNPFGDALKPLIDQGLTTPQAYLKLVKEDSDKDGKSNGLELGDPCGTWIPGTNPDRTTDITSPGDASAVTKATPPPNCASPATGEGGAGGASGAGGGHEGGEGGAGHEGTGGAGHEGGASPVPTPGMPHFGSKPVDQGGCTIGGAAGRGASGLSWASIVAGLALLGARRRRR